MIMLEVLLLLTVTRAFRIGLWRLRLSSSEQCHLHNLQWRTEELDGRPI